MEVNQRQNIGPKCFAKEFNSYLLPRENHMEVNPEGNIRPISFVKKFISKFFSPIEYHTIGVRAIICIIWYWLVLKNFIGWKVRTTVNVIVVSRSCTVVRWDYVLSSCVALQEGNRKIFRMSVTDMSCAQNVLSP